MLRQITIGLVPSFVAVAVLAGIGAPLKVARAGEIEEKCHGNFPKWHQYFDRRDCIKELGRERARREFKKKTEEIANRREEKARTCIAKDLARMESLAKKARDSVKEKMTLEDAVAALDSILPTKSRLEPTKHNIKEWVAINRIPTKCASTFFFLVNIIALESRQLKSFNIWAETAPKGYRGGYRKELSKDFEDIRKTRAKDRQFQEILRIGREKRQRAKAEKKRKAEAARKKRMKETQRRRRAEGEAAKKRLRELARESEHQRHLREVERRDAREAEKRRRASTPPTQKKDHCAPNISRAERLKRLQENYGQVRQTGSSSFVAGGHSISFLTGNRLYSCN